jgi:biopolymer transport protein ExbB/TolQ
MNLVEWLQRLMTNFGAGWVLWLLMVLSIISVAIMLERGWFYWSLRDDVARLASDLRERLRDNDLDAAKKRMEASPSAEAAVVVAGLLEADRGAKSAEEAMQGAVALQRMKLERRLAYLGTLGNNAPFIGLFGTVLGIIKAFNDLGQMNAKGASMQQTVMSGISEALVATAVGLAVAIPAVVAFNVFNRQLKTLTSRTNALGHALVGSLRAQRGSSAPRAVAAGEAR